MKSNSLDKVKPAGLAGRDGNLNDAPKITLDAVACQLLFAVGVVFFALAVYGMLKGGAQ